MECLNCNKTMKYKDKILAEFYLCETCFYETIIFPNSSCCMCPNDKPVKFYKDERDAFLDNDNYLVYNQCKNCGRKNGTSLKKANYNKQDLPYFNYEIEENIQVLRKEIQEHSKEIDKRKIENRQDTFWNDYNEYLKSEEWKIKRELVLKRDNNLCQSCLSETAMEVHHKVGIFRKNEPLFSLVSVCGKCHTIITQIERGNHKEAEKITHKK